MMISNAAGDADESNPPCLPQVGLTQSRWSPRVSTPFSRAYTSNSVDNAKIVDGKIVSHPEAVKSPLSSQLAPWQAFRRPARPLYQAPKDRATRTSSDAPTAPPQPLHSPKGKSQLVTIPNPGIPVAVSDPKTEPPSPPSSVEIILERQPTNQKSDKQNSRQKPLSFSSAHPRMTAKNHGSKWPTAAEVKFDLRNHPERMDPSGASDVASNVADFDAEVGTRRPDQGQDYKLTDWTGAMAPAPVDWDDRPAFIDDRIQEKIQEWASSNHSETNPVDIGEHKSELPLGFTRQTWLRENEGASPQFSYSIEKCKDGKCNLGAGEHFLQTLRGEIALRSWVPEAIDCLPLESWWNRHLRIPEAERDVEPFWRRFISSTTSLAELVVPTAMVEPSENDMILVKTQTSENSRLTFDNQKMKRTQKLKQERREHRALADSANEYIPSQNQYAPRVNIYLRPVEGRDLSQVAEIYNHYIENTIFCPESEPLRPSTIRRRWEDIAEVRLPFLVAVDRSAKGSRRKGPNKKISQDEHIVGFGLADDYNDQRGLYRYTVEMEVYVRREFSRRGVGRCLVDRLLHILDPHYVERGGFEFIGDPIAFGSGGKRVVGSIIVNIPYDSKDKSRLEWLTEWLKQFQFAQVGDLPEVGHKLNTVSVQQST